MKIRSTRCGSCGHADEPAVAHSLCPWCGGILAPASAALVDPYTIHPPRKPRTAQETSP